MNPSPISRPGKPPGLDLAPADDWLATPGRGFTTQAVSGSFSQGVLTVIGDSLDNTTTVSRNAAGVLLVNGGAVPVQGGTATVANTSLIQVFGLGGNDRITLDERNGALPRANLFGGAGNDVLTGGSGADLLFGQSGNDTLLGKGGADFLFGGEGHDVLTGGDGNDQMFGESGDDRLIWNPGDDSDLFEGGAGTDTAEVNGGNGAETFSVTANGTRVRLDRVDPAPFALDIGSTERLVVAMNGGDDSFSATGNLAALIGITVDGGAGNDRILGSNGADLLIGGDGNDFIDGQQGNDVAFLGAGADVFQWDPGDGSDVVEGQGGADTMLFNGSAGNEVFEVAANGGRVRFTRNLGNIVMDLDDVETLDLNALGGADTVVIGDLSGTDLKRVDVDLAGAPGGSAGDAQADTVAARGTQAADSVDITGSGTSLSVAGLAALLTVDHGEGALDGLRVETQGGDDRIDASTLVAGITRLTMDGGAGADRLFGSRGDDLLIGGDGDDLIVGRQGNDTALMGAGNDRFVWNPGDGSDVIEGQDGSDELEFFGAGANEAIDIAAVGGRVRFFRDVGNIVMDLDDVEKISFRALGGADQIVIGDLGGTDVQAVAIDLAGAGGGAPDGQADSVTGNGSNAADQIVVKSVQQTVTISGPSAAVSIEQTEAQDRLVVNALAGDDVVDASGLAAGGMALQLNGGLGNDVLIGGAGGDLMFGGDGDDLALMGAGDDTFVWNPGDDNDTIEGQSGHDALQFNGANVAENIQIFANGGRALFFRDIANVAMDMNDVEAIRFAALGGADRIVVGDLSGTDVTEVGIDLAAAGGGGDAQADRVTVLGTAGADVISVSLVDGKLVVDGLASRVVITGFEAGTDQLVIEGLGGDDIIDGSLLPAGFGIVAGGGDGDDVLLGGEGADALLGGDGDDVLLGNGGDDVLDGGAGDDVLIGGDGIDVLSNGEIEIAGFAAGGLASVEHPTLQRHAGWLGAHVDGFVI